MEKDEKVSFKQLKSALSVSSVGLVLVISILMGIGIGTFIDKKTGYAPWGTVVMGVLGAVSGFRSAYMFVKKAIKELEDEERDEEKKGTL